MSSNIAILDNTKIKHESPSREAMRRLFHHRSAIVGMSILGFLLILAIFAKQIAPYDPTQILRDVDRRAPPCIHLLGCPEDQPQHWFGTMATAAIFCRG